MHKPFSHTHSTFQSKCVKKATTCRHRENKKRLDRMGEIHFASKQYQVESQKIGEISRNENKYLDENRNAVENLGCTKALVGEHEKVSR